MFLRIVIPKGGASYKLDDAKSNLWQLQEKISLKQTWATCDFMDPQLSVNYFKLGIIQQ